MCKLCFILGLLIFINHYSICFCLVLERGTLEPIEEKCDDGKIFYSFRNVPYAKPPIGKFRFRETELADPLEGVRHSLEEVPNCLQEHKGSIIGQEDCLYLNLYKPQVKGSDDKSLLPIMVFFHGGAFVSGSANEEIFHPNNFMKEDVILVVPNYRLGIFGFLHSDDESADIPGNAGLKDQVLALKWVQKNARYFGGDPNLVTIFGICGGSVSTHLHILSPLSRGLFHRAIAQSGSAFNPWGLGSQNTADEIADMLDINKDDPQEMAYELRKIEAKKLMEAQLKLVPPNAIYNELPTSPVIENYIIEGRTFLSDNDFDTNSSIADVPLILGYTDAEGIIVDFLNRAIYNKSMAIDLRNFEPKYFDGEDEEDEFFNKIKQFYFNDKEPNLDNIDEYIKLITDAWFMVGVREAANFQLRKSKSPIYFYRFSMDTKLNFVKNMNPVTAKYLGASHGDEIGYLFAHGKSLIINSTEDINVKRLIKIWTTFAKTGNPNVKNNELINVEWEPLTTKQFNYLELGNTLSVDVNPDEDRYDFWCQIMDV